MNKLTKISFNIFKFSAAGFILLYFLLTVIVGAAGHSSGDSSELIKVAVFSLILFLLINYYQKRATAGRRIRLIFKILFVILVIATVVISTIGLYIIQQRWIETLSTIVCLILGLYVASGLLILKFIFWDKSQISADTDNKNIVE